MIVEIILAAICNEFYKKHVGIGVNIEKERKNRFRDLILTARSPQTACNLFEEAVMQFGDPSFFKEARNKRIDFLYEERIGKAIFMKENYIVPKLIREWMYYRREDNKKIKELEGILENYEKILYEGEVKWSDESFNDAKNAAEEALSSSVIAESAAFANMDDD
jgi:hypothetical protein